MMPPVPQADDTIKQYERTASDLSSKINGRLDLQNQIDAAKQDILQNTTRTTELEAKIDGPTGLQARLQDSENRLATQMKIGSFKNQEIANLKEQLRIAKIGSKLQSELYQKLRDRTKIINEARFSILEGIYGLFKQGPIPAEALGDANWAMNADYEEIRQTLSQDLERITTRIILTQKVMDQATELSEVSERKVLSQRETIRSLVEIVKSTEEDQDKLRVLQNKLSAAKMLVIHFRID